MRNLNDVFKIQGLQRLLKSYNILNEEINTIKDLLELEWNFFNEVHGLEGRAICQDEALTFSVMRLAQYLSFKSEIRKYILEDFETAKLQNRNTITEKYARMMKYTDPLEFKEKWYNSLPEVSVVKRNILSQIRVVLESMTKEALKDYPAIASKTRPLTSVNSNVSSVDYFLCEITSYSIRTLKYLLDDIKLYKTKGNNLVENIFKNTVILQNSVGRSM